MKYFKQGVIPLVVILVLSMIPLMWFKNDCLIAGGDSNQYMSVGKFAKNHLYYLVDENMGQYSHGWISLVSSMGFFWWLFKLFGSADAIIQRLWFVFLWFFSMGGMYLLIKEVAGKEYSKTGAIIGSFLYMANIFSASMALNFFVSLTFLVLPYLMLVTIRAVKSYQRENLNVLYFALIILFGATILMNPGYSYILFFLPLSYILFNAVCPLSLENLLRRLKLVFKLCLFSGIASAFFLLPYLFSMKDTFGEMYAIAHGGFFAANYLQAAFRFLASWAFQATHYKMPYCPWSHNYFDSFWVVFATFLIPVMVFCGLVFQKRFKKDILFFCLISFLGLFLSKGVGQPLGKLYQWAFDHIPLFTAFREPWSKFTQLSVFSFSILLGLGFSEIKQNIGSLKLRRIIIPVFAGIVVCCVVTAAFPIFTGEIFYPYWNGSVKGQYIKVPDYWNKTAAYLREQSSNDTVFLTPRSSLSVYEWDRGVSTMLSVPSLILDNPVMKYGEYATVVGRKILNLVYGLIEPASSYEFSRLLKLLSPKYVLQQNDMDWRFLPAYTYSPEIMEKILKRQPGLEKLRTIGKLDIYKVSNEYFLPEIYVADNHSLVYGELKEMPKFLFTPFLDKKPLINFIDSEILHSAMHNLDLYDNIIVAVEEDRTMSIEKPTTLIYDFSEEESEITFVQVPKGEYTVRLAYESREQEETLCSLKDMTIAPTQPENSRIKFLGLNFMDLEEEIPDFSVKPVLANWKYESYCHQPREKELVLENFNSEMVNVDLGIRFKYYWKGTVKLVDGNTDRFISEGALDDFSDFVEMKDVSVKPGKNFLKVLCIPAETDKNWPEERITAQKDIGVKISGRRQPLENNFLPRNKVVLQTDYKLTVSSGIRQIDFLFYLDSDSNQEVDAWMQVTVDDRLMRRGFGQFKIDIMEAMRERLDDSGYNILAADMVCYPSRGGEIEDTEEKIAGGVILRDFLITHIYYLPYEVCASYLERNFNMLNPFNGFLSADFKQISNKDCYPLIIEVKGAKGSGKKTEINLPEDKVLGLKWAMFIPENKTGGSGKACGMITKIDKISPVMYRAKVEADEPCFVVFSRNFHPGWKAFIQSETYKSHFLNKSVLFAYMKNKMLHGREIGNHIKVNGFANAWYLGSRDIEELKGDDKGILLIYYSQIIQELGMLISSLFLIGGIIYIIRAKLKLRNFQRCGE